MTLDPDDWTAVHALGRRMVDDMLDYQQTIRERAPWRPVPPEVQRGWPSRRRSTGRRSRRSYESFLRDVLPYPTGNGHPRFWGWVMGTGTPTGMLAEMLAAA